MKADKPLDPLHMSLLGSIALMSGPDGLTHSVQELGGRSSRDVSLSSTQPLQRSVARGAYILGPAIDPDPASFAVVLEPELGRNDDSVAAMAELPADEPLVDPRPV